MPSGAQIGRGERDAFALLFQAPDLILAVDKEETIVESIGINDGYTVSNNLGNGAETVPVEAVEGVEEIWWIVYRGTIRLVRRRCGDYKSITE